MKGLLRIYRNYFITAVLLGIFILIINLVFFVAASISISSRESLPEENYVFKVIADEVLSRKGESYQLTELGKQYLEETDKAFVMYLDGRTGEILYSWNLPENLNKVYSLGDVAAFSRWYLDGYPVQVWNWQEGLLVVGEHPGQSIKFYFNYSEKSLIMMKNIFPIMLGFNLCLLFILIFITGNRFRRSVIPVDHGILQLSQGKDVHIQVKGALRELGERLNQTSDILKKQREQIDRRDTARTEWIAGVSHDIRTPLSVIMGYSENMEDNPLLPDEVRDQAGIIKEQSIKIRQLIEDLNLTSKLEYDMQPLRIKDYKPAVLLRSLVSEFINEGLEEAYDLRLEIENGVEKMVCRGDVQLLKRAVRNLIQNSIRHNPQGCEIQVEIKQEKEKIRISVSDTGKGISREVREYLEYEKQISGIHVMGLKIVRQIVRSHKGDMRISDQGRTVTLVLPMEPF